LVTASKLIDTCQELFLSVVGREILKIPFNLNDVGIIVEDIKVYTSWLDFYLQSDFKSLCNWRSVRALQLRDFS